MWVLVWWYERRLGVLGWMEEGGGGLLWYSNALYLTEQYIVQGLVSH